MTSFLPTSNLLGPVIALNGWAFVMEAWMYATRMPAYRKIDLKNTLTKAQLEEQTPAPVRWKADNYNHLMEQPTQFYAIALLLAIARGGKNDRIDAYLAWGYVGVRVVHSFVQVTTNHIMRRFGVFLVSSSLIAAMTFRAAKTVFRF